MPIIPRLAGAGYCQQISPLVLAGTGWMDNTELGFSVAANAITVAARVDSNPILVAGFNDFMVIAELSGAWNLSFSHCDPTTNAILFTASVAAAIPGPGLQLRTFGAFSAAAAGAAHVWWVLRVGLQGNVADRTLTSIRMWCGTR
jgi:hypothetical protein